MLKLLGSLCILGGGSFMCLSRIRERQRERNTLSELAAALEQMAQQIRQTRKPLPQLLQNLAEEREGDAAVFFRQIATGLRQGHVAVSAWKQAAESLPLEAEEQKLLVKAGRCLQGDEQEICKGLSLASEMLSRISEEKRLSKAEQDKRTAAMCFSGAALLVILLI